MKNVMKLKDNGVKYMHRKLKLTYKKPSVILRFA